MSTLQDVVNDDDDNDVVEIEVNRHFVIAAATTAALHSVWVNKVQSLLHTWANSIHICTH